VPALRLRFSPGWTALCLGADQFEVLLLQYAKLIRSELIRVASEDAQPVRVPKTASKTTRRIVFPPFRFLETAYTVEKEAE